MCNRREVLARPNSVSKKNAKAKITNRKKTGLNNPKHKYSSPTHDRKY